MTERSWESRTLPEYFIRAHHVSHDGLFFLCCPVHGAEVNRAFRLERSGPVLDFADQRSQGINIGREVLTVQGGKRFYMADDVEQLGPPSGELSTHAVAEIFNIHMCAPSLNLFYQDAHRLKETGQSASSSSLKVAPVGGTVKKAEGSRTSSPHYGRS